MTAQSCKQTRVSLTKLRSGAIRAELVCKLTEYWDIAAAEVAGQAGTSTFGISKLLSRSLSRQLTTLYLTNPHKTLSVGS